MQSTTRLRGSADISGFSGFANRLSAALAATVLVAACSGDDGSASLATAEFKADLKSLASAYADESAETLRGNDDALRLGRELFGAYCADCHGSDGRGKRDVMDLTRGRFDFGLSADAVRTTIMDGRTSEMPAMGREYGEVELGQLVAYLDTLPVGGELSANAERGRALYAEGCASCHGEDGRGQAEDGAPDLVDDYWRHGDSMMNIRLVITRGVQSECPAQGAELDPAEVELLTAYVLYLASGGDGWN
jgi:cytochrome c oxidase cbb3-type subunit 3